MDQNPSNRSSRQSKTKTVISKTKTEMSNSKRNTSKTKSEISNSKEIKEIYRSQNHLDNGSSISDPDAGSVNLNSVSEQIRINDIASSVAGTIVDFDIDEDRKFKKMDPDKEQLVLAYIASLPHHQIGTVSPISGISESHSHISSLGVLPIDLSEIPLLHTSSSLESMALEYSNDSLQSLHNTSFSDTSSESSILEVPWPSLAEATMENQCQILRTERDQEENEFTQCHLRRRCRNRIGKPMCPRRPIPEEGPMNVTKAYWDLYKARVYRAPSPSKFRTHRFSIQENRTPKPYTGFPPYDYAIRRRARCWTQGLIKNQIARIGVKLRYNIEELNRDFYHYDTL